MAEYAFATDFFGFAQIGRGYIAWPRGGAEAEVISQLEPGDLVVPKFAQSPTTGTNAAGIAKRELEQKAYCEEIETEKSFDELRARYERTVNSGENAVPYALTVTGRLADENALGRSWARSSVNREDFVAPFSTQEFLRLRAIPEELARQLKGMVAPGRHLQELPEGTVEELRAAAGLDDRSGVLCKYSLVRTTTADEAVASLKQVNRDPQKGDAFYLVADDLLGPAYRVGEAGQLTASGSALPLSPEALRALIVDAQARAKAASKWFPARPGLLAADQLAALLQGGSAVVAVDNFAHFHDRFVLLDSRTTQATTLREQLPESGGTESGSEIELEDEDEATSEEDELVQLEGATIVKLREQLPGMEIPDSVLAEAITALRAGKHLLLSGPPGTGKSTIAEAICRTVVGRQYDVSTATADWTTFDTIGGYMPSGGANVTLRFEPGVVLRALQTGRWLVIDELNRADIDKAFGPLFTLLAGTGGQQPGKAVILPYQEDGVPIAIRWAASRTAVNERFVLTPTWRLLGTLNISDKASLFQLSFAFLRRFAVVDVPLPPREKYTAWFGKRCHEIDGAHRDKIIEAAMNLAHATETRELGPAILADVAHFISTGLVQAASGQRAYDDPVSAFLTAIRLYAVPQYEGSTAAEVDAATKAVLTVWSEDELPPDYLASYRAALRAVAMA